MRELTEILDEALVTTTRRLEGAVPAPDVTTVLRRRVRRGRAARHTARAVVSLPIVALLGVGGWWVLGGHQDQPPTPPATSTADPTPEPTDASPSPSQRPSRGPSAEPTGTPPPDVAPEPAPVVVPGAPDAVAAPADLLGRTGPGWVVSVHRPARYAGDAPDGSSVFTAERHVVQVVSPDGSRYHVAELDPEVLVEPVRWTGGPEVRVLVDVADGRTSSIDPDLGVLDLRTGDVRTGRPAPGEVLLGTVGGEELWHDQAGARVVALADDGTERLVTDRADAALVSPDGLHVVVREEGASPRLARVDGTDERPLEVSTGSGPCEVVGWIDADRLHVVCTDDPARSADGVGANPVTHTLDVDSGSLDAGRAVATGGPLPRPWSGRTAEGGMLVHEATDGHCWVGVAVVGDGGAGWLLDLRDLGENLVRRTATVDGRLLVESGPGCAGDAAPTNLRSVDLATGDVVDLAPRPDGGWNDSLAGWSVVH